MHCECLLLQLTFDMIIISITSSVLIYRELLKSIQMLFWKVEEVMLHHYNKRSVLLWYKLLIHWLVITGIWFTLIIQFDMESFDRHPLIPTLNLETQQHSVLLFSVGNTSSLVMYNL